MAFRIRILILPAVLLALSGFLAGAQSALGAPTPKKPEPSWGPSGLKKQQEEELLRVLNQYRRDVHRRLVRLRDTDQGAYRDAMQAEWAWYVQWRKMPTEVRGPAITKRQAEQSIGHLLSRLAGAGPKPAESLVAELATAVGQRFDADMVLTKYRLDQLDKAIGSTRSELKRRSERREKILDDRVARYLKYATTRPAERSARRRRPTTMPAVPSLDKELERELLGVLAKRRPDLHKRLLSLRERKDPHYAGTLRRTYRWYEKWKDLPASVQEKFFEQDRAHQEIWRLVRRIRRGEPREKLLPEIRAEVARMFDAEQAVKAYHLSESVRHVERLRRELAARAKRRDRIIQDSVAHLLKSVAPKTQKGQPGPSRTTPTGS